MDKSMSYVQKHRAITKSRLANFVSDGQWEDVNARTAINEACASGKPHIELGVWSAPGQERPAFEHAVQQQFAPIDVGHVFTPSWSTHWVRAAIQIPKEFAGKPVRLEFDASCEAMVWSDAGEPLQGLTGGNSQRRCEFTLADRAGADEPLRVLYLEVACNGMFGNGLSNFLAAPDANRKFPLKTMRLVVPNVEGRALIEELAVLRAMSNGLDQDSPRAWHALAAANDAINAFTAGDQKSIAAARAAVAGFFAAKGGDGNHQVYAIGNCHIDTAWLWPYDETKRKIARSWAAQLDLLDRYPEYRFAASQAQQFEWLQELYPRLFERIQAKAKTGQFIPIGGTWIEMDCNVPSGEALARQFLLGQRYFERHFGVRAKVFWLPDTFGYSSQIPQIMRLAGTEYFYTQKLSWNNINKFPHTTFRWIGLDGSTVLTHMSPAETYTADVSIGDLIDSIKKHKDVVYSNESLYLYGHGDGGGGPCEDMLERLRLVGDLDGLPRVKHAHPNEFYEHVDRTARDLVSWKGELYFELHRGTYTTQAATKKCNRQAEFALRDAELLSVIAQSAARGFAYPAAELERLWKLVCLNQFHDVLPGTSIEMVYKDTDKIYADVLGSVAGLKQSAVVALAGHAAAQSPDAATGVLLVNTTGWPRTEVVAVPAAGPAGGSWQTRASDGARLMVAAAVPGCGTAVVDATSTAAAIPGSSTSSSDLSVEEQTGVAPVGAFEDKDGNVVLENIYVTAKISKSSGQLVSLWDRRAERELVPPGRAGNVFRLHDDAPLYWDAWDIEIYSMEKFAEQPAAEVTVADAGPLVASACVQVPIGKGSSRLKQWVSLSATSPRLNFDCEVDWHENRKCLKVGFTWDIHSDYATYDTQFGVVQRPTHRNTTWEMAKFEVCGHKFADLSEYGYGVALLNDCKYGYATLGSTMSLSLLRASKAPDANCDMGRHTFRYAVYPHAGTFTESDVVREAYQFNVPLVQLPVDAAGAGAVAGAGPFFSVEGAPSVVLDTVKAAEGDSRCVVVRLYETYGGHARATLVTRLPAASAHLANILEERTADAKVVAAPAATATAAAAGDGHAIELAFKPFEVVTVKLELKA
ncbi:Glycoside hydrolase, 38 vacuolar alpha mannosidase [Coemansia javaensis]|uniref:Alpha-mannosidase n=1 Tax=Coemansia javaensis TaxID=2761396 RepID=A0A9W8HFV7_9FUNG|nr:Glycoside hydrolase, 38 vacuolar alpha mannosidase [Coemansia javaensis]